LAAALLALHLDDLQRGRVQLGLDAATLGIAALDFVAAVVDLQFFSRQGSWTSDGGSVRSRP
jgi:hypothetical protein